MAIAKRRKVNRAIILAAGNSRRLFPLTKTCPKCLLGINGQTLLERTLSALVESDIKEVIIITGHGRFRVEKAVAEFNYSGWVRFLFNPFYAVTNNLVSLGLARPLMDDGFLLINSDLYFDNRILFKLTEAEGDCLVIERQKPLGEEEMKVKIEDGRIVDIGKDLLPSVASGEYIGMAKFLARGGSLLKEKLTEHLARNGYQEFYESAIKDLFVPIPIKPVFTDGLPWIEIDTPEDLAKAQDLGI